ncbi:CASP-like protein 4A1 [Andrographis paniculata]|uniref:CASP-like protein 4A1 n=1 Tax=Andrographis paniculata TaxID=175694 RepID=UPI0021E80044|nr:CASP-like protein 4A1 [Andrographis paniculata]
MESERTKRPTSLSPDSISHPQNITAPGDHISLSPPEGSPGKSPAESYSSLHHSKHSSGHISLSPTLGSKRNSPARSSVESDRTSINLSHGSSPEYEAPRSAERIRPAVVSKDVFMEPKENVVVIEEPMAVVNRVVLEEPKAKKGEATKGYSGGGEAEVGGRRKFKPSLSILRRAKREKMVKQAGLGFRVFGSLFCLVSLSVMAANRNQGWALDSFYRYKEFRYCMSVNVIGFVYSGAQAFELSYNLATGKYAAHQHHLLRHYLDFAFDQIIAYLLISASSSATIRVEDWQSNWGNDKFPGMATTSVSISFLAFVAFAASSLVSGYVLCTSKSL